MNVEFELKKEKEIQLQIISMEGAEVFKEIFFAKEGNNRVQINAPVSLKTGTYVLRIIEGTNPLSSTKIFHSE